MVTEGMTGVENPKWFPAFGREDFTVPLTRPR